MFERISAGLTLAKQAANVLRLDKELLLFPILSSLCCGLVIASFFVPMYALGLTDGSGPVAETTQSKILFGIFGFLFYFANYFVIVFFNSALIGCAVIRLKGGDPSVGDGFATSMSRLPQIAAWSAVAATVGMLLKSFENKNNKLGQLIIGLLGTAWTILTFFVVPVIVIEKLGPIAAVKRSASLLKEAWGESLTSTFSIKLFTFLASLLGIIPMIAGVFLVMNGMGAVGIPLLIVGVLVLMAVSVISSALNSIVLAALYIYAVEGEAPASFDPDLVENAFASK